MTRIEWRQRLLSKFPTLDPAWSDDVRSKWFEIFDKLMELGLEAEEKT